MHSPCGRQEPRKAASKIEDQLENLNKMYKIIGTENVYFSNVQKLVHDYPQGLTIHNTLRIMTGLIDESLN